MALLTPHWEALTPKTRAAFYMAAGLPFTKVSTSERAVPHQLPLLCTQLVADLPSQLYDPDHCAPGESVV